MTHESPETIAHGGLYFYDMAKPGGPNPANEVSLCALTCVVPLLRPDGVQKTIDIFLFRFFFVGIVSAIVLFNTLASPPKKRNWYMSSLSTLYLANFFVTAVFMCIKKSDWNCASAHTWYNWKMRDTSPV